MSITYVIPLVLLSVTQCQTMKCGQNPLFYVTRNYEDTYEFWIDTIISLKSHHCPRQGSIGWLLDCFFMDTDYKTMEYHMWYICQYYGMLQPESMRALIQKYCMAHRYEAMAAYQCTSGCPLADHINQICMTMYAPRKPYMTTTTASTTTTTTTTATTTPTPFRSDNVAGAQAQTPGSATSSAGTQAAANTTTAANATTASQDSSDDGGN